MNQWTCTNCLGLSVNRERCEHCGAASPGEIAEYVRQMHVSPASPLGLRFLLWTVGMFGLGALAGRLTRSWV